MKRIAVVRTSVIDLDTCKRRLADARIPIVNVQMEQRDYLSIHVEDPHFEAALRALRKGGFDAAEIPPNANIP